MAELWEIIHAVLTFQAVVRDLRIQRDGLH